MQKIGPKENKWNSKYFSEWNDQLKELVADRISSLKGHFKSPKCKVLDQPDVKFCTELLWGRIDILGQEKSGSNR